MDFGARSNSRDPAPLDDKEGGFTASLHPLQRAQARSDWNDLPSQRLVDREEEVGIDVEPRMTVGSDVHDGDGMPAD